jgi:primosomal protein N' (replication factor Y)
VSLTYHRTEQKLSCHICGHNEKVPLVCPEPKCKNPAIRFAGTGTQKVEEVLAKLFPKARVRRMDADTMKRKDDYRHVLGDFRAGKIDILVGTQMIAKGLHFPNVTLVGIIYADSAHVPTAHAGCRPRRPRRRGGRGVCAGVHAVSSGHPIRAPPRLRGFLRAGN